MTQRSSTAAGVKKRGRGPKRKRKIVHYSPELAEVICERIAYGEMWFRMAGEPGLPEYTTVYNWVKTRPDFAEAWAQAKAMAADLCADKVLVVSDEGTPESLPRDRLRVGSWKWHVARAEGGPGKSKIWERSDGQRLEIRIRQFERAYREDGTPYVLEVRPTDATEDGE